MIEINLIPDVKQELLKAQRIRSTVISTSILVSIITGGIILLLLIYIFAVQTVRGAIADEGIKAESQKLSQVEDLSKILTIQNQLTKISDLNEQKKITSRLFSVISAVIPSAPNQVSLSSFVVNAEENKITLEGQAPNGYPALEVFKKTLESAEVRYIDTTDGESYDVNLASDIVVGNVSDGQDTSGTRVLRFSVSFIYPYELLAPTSDSVRIAITVQGNVTDSYLGVPKSLFAEKAADIEEGE